MSYYYEQPNHLWSNISRLLVQTIIPLQHVTYGEMNVFIRIIGLLMVSVIVIYFMKPINRIRNVTDIGWGHMKDKMATISKLEVVKEAQKRRKIGELPPVFPNGWFAIEESKLLQKGEVRSVSVFGVSLAVFRAEDGNSYVLDAYCPHLGANMAVGGTVKGNCLQCPFHGWMFGGQTGHCVSIPYANKVPEFAKVKKWTSKELNGFIFVWYDAEGRSPLYEIPLITEVSSNIWKYRGRSKHQVLTHIQDIPENGSDIAHLGHLHVPNIMKGADLKSTFAKHWVLDIVRHKWDGEWNSEEGENCHIGRMKLKHEFSFFNDLFHLMGLEVSAEQIGPSLVHLFFDTPFGKGVLIQTVTPAGPLNQTVIHHFCTSSLFIAPIAKLVMLAESFHVERDIMIWNSKQFLSKPLLVKEDKYIKKFRRWYGQFYSENSPTYASCQNKSLDW